MNDRENRAKEAYGEGKDAFKDGKARSDNPNARGSLEWSCWEHSWMIEFIEDKREK